ncbi:MAG: PAS domain-containing protein [Geobacteraceae bacterium]|nr:PAS domain-containing protein [Geobacteraceae bacterium]
MVASRSPIIDKVDRKLAFSFGAVMLVLMLLVTATSSYLFIRLQSQEEDRLSGALARIIAESVSKVSFSGTYHARLFVEEIKAKTPEISSVSLVSREGQIIAHSNPGRNGAVLTGEDLAMLRQCLAQNSTVVGERYRNGGKEKVIVLPYGGGIDAETIGVIRLVIDVAKVRQEQRTGIVTIVVIATALSCAAVVLILLLSRYFGSAVKELAMQLQAILDNSPALIYVKDQTGRYQFVNQAWCRLFQTSNDNVKGKTDRELFPEEVALQFMTNDQRVMTSDRQLTLEEQLPVGEEIRYYHSIKVAVRDTNGATHGLCGISTDISERKKAEETLRESEERLQLATQAAGIGIWDWDVVRNRLLWDESMYRLYGIRREDFNGAYEAWFRCIHPNDAALTDHAIQAALSGEKEYGPEFRIVRPDGAVRLIQAAAKTFRDQDGKPLRMIGINLDITEQKQAEESIRLLNEELEQRVQERTAELETKNAELERTIRLFVGRELRMIELKEQIRSLEGTPDTEREENRS